MEVRMLSLYQDECAKVMKGVCVAYTDNSGVTAEVWVSPILRSMDHFTYETLREYLPNVRSVIDAEFILRNYKKAILTCAKVDGKYVLPKSRVVLTETTDTNASLMDEIAGELGSGTESE